MRRSLLTVIIALASLLESAVAQGMKSKTKMPSCESVSSSLAAAIRQNPQKLEIRLEDALVINEACTAEIVTAAIDAVNADPALVRKIFEVAVNVVPHRAHQVQMAVVNFAVPAAVAVRVEPDWEVRPAQTAQGQPAFEVRRAEVPVAGQHVPIEEVRKAVAAAPAPVVAMEPQIEIRKADLSPMLGPVPRARPLRKSR